MKKSVEEMKDELIENGLIKPEDEKVYYQMSEEETKEELSRLIKEKNKLKDDLLVAKYSKYEYRDYESYKWNKLDELEHIEAAICSLKNGYGLIKESDDEYDDDYIAFLYVQAMFDEEIQLDEEIVKEYLLKEAYYYDNLSNKELYDENLNINNKEIFQKAIELTRKYSFIARLADENLIKEILSDVNEMKKILNQKQTSKNSLSGKKELKAIISELIRCDELCKDKEFIIKLMDNMIKLNIEDSNIVYVIAEKCDTLLLDEEFTEKLFDFFEITKIRIDSDDCEIFCEKLLPGELSKNQELAYRYCKIFENIDSVNKELIENKEFFLKILDECNLYRFNLPKKFLSDIEVLEKYFSNTKFLGIDRTDGINIEVLNNERIAKIIEERYEMKPNEIFLNTIADKIENTGKIVTHFGDDLDNKAAIEAIHRWAEDNDLIKIGYPLNVIRVPAGQVKEGALNIDTGGHKGSKMEDIRDTIIIDGDIENGVKSACEALSRLGIYVPEQIIELADAKTNKVSSLDSRSGLALVRYLNGEQTFKLAEAKLLDKSLSDEQLKEYGLTTAHKKQQEIIDNAITKIEKYTKELPNGEKIVLSPEQIISGSSIAYEKGINYYASASEHFNSRGIPDGITFAITSKPGIQLPEEVLEYGKKLSEIYKTGENTSDVFVNPNNEMIIAGGFKNPEFKIAGENVEGMLNKILEIFEGKNQER